MTTEKKDLYVENDMYDEDDEDTQKDRFLTFSLKDEDYGIEIKHVTEIIGLQKITAVPDMPEFVRGMINLRGKVIPVMDVRKRFSLGDREFDDRTCIIVVNINDNSVGLIVDRVRDVAIIPETEIEPAPSLQKKNSGRFVQGMGKIGDDVKILIDVNKLLHDDDLEQIEAVIEEKIAA